jgi:hypothetical protein
VSTDFNILTTLWGKAKDHLDDAELKDVANLDEHAASLAGGLSDIVEDIGCMVLADDRPGLKAGNFTNADDASTLLFSISRQLDYINGLFHLSAEAGFRLSEAKTKTTTKGAKV